MKQWNEASGGNKPRQCPAHGEGNNRFLPSLPITRHKAMCERAAFTQATGGQGSRPRQQAGSRPDSEGPRDLRKGAKLSKNLTGSKEVYTAN